MYNEKSLLEHWQDDVQTIEDGWRCLFENIEILTKFIAGLAGGLLLCFLSPIWLPIYLLARKLIQDGR